MNTPVRCWTCQAHGLIRHCKNQKAFKITKKTVLFNLLDELKTVRVLDQWTSLFLPCPLQIRILPCPFILSRMCMLPPGAP